MFKYIANYHKYWTCSQGINFDEVILLWHVLDGMYCLIKDEWHVLDGIMGWIGANRDRWIVLGRHFLLFKYIQPTFHHPSQKHILKSTKNSCNNPLCSKVFLSIEFLILFSQRNSWLLQLMLWMKEQEGPGCSSGWEQGWEEGCHWGQRFKW